MAADTMPEPIERVRMALAEVGYPPSAIRPPSRHGATFDFSPSLPRDEMWRARECALIGQAQCFPCWVQRTTEARRLGYMPPAGCIATRRFEQDCGVDRGR